MDSLILGGLEMLGTATNPEYRLGQGLDLGAAQPDQATISSILLDGDVLSGDRYRNRQINLSVRVFSNLPSSATIAQIRSALSTYCDTLAQAVAAKTFTLQWTPDGGLPVIYDCYRGTATRQRTIVGDNQQVTLVTLTFQARPFGRSPVAQTVAVTSTLQVDSFDTAPTGATLNTTTKYEGTGSGQFTSWSYSGIGINPGSTSDTMSRSFAAKDISAYSAVSLRVRADTVATFNTVTLTLTSASGSTKFTGLLSVAANQWAVIYLPLTGGTVTAGTGVTLSAVTAWSLVLFARNQDMTGGHVVLVDDMRAAGTAATIIGPTSHAAVLAVPVSVGSARTPANLTLASSSGTFAAFMLHSPPPEQDPNVAILTALSNALTDQTVTIATLNAGFRGTYAAVLGVDTVGSGSITATITITQKANGVTVGSPTTITKTYTAGAHLVPVGDVTLPLYDVPADNTTTTFTIRVQVTGAERYTELMLLDTIGQTIFTDQDLTSNAVNVYVDEPSPLQSGSSVYGGGARSVAYSLLGNCLPSGGPILLEPGVNKFLAWVSTNTPVVTATYYPRWLDERVA